MALGQELRDKLRIALCLTGFGGAASSRGRPERGARLLGATAALCQLVGVQLELEDQMAYDQDLAMIRSQLAAEALQQAWEEGCAMTLEQAIAYALEPG
jgi:hypothetical protein